MRAKAEAKAKAIAEGGVPEERKKPMAQMTLQEQL